jgi:hypothetical protein
MSGDRFTFATDFIKGRFNLDQLKAIVAKGNIDTPERRICGFWPFPPKRAQTGMPIRAEERRARRCSD